LSRLDFFAARVVSCFFVVLSSSFDVLSSSFDALSSGSVGTGGAVISL
jgi:hypothetical protein